MTTKITNDNIADNSITVDKLAPSTVANLYTAGDGITIEANGRISAVSVGPTITGFTVQGTDDLALDPAGGQTVVVQGSRFQEGATVQVGANVISVVTFIDSTTLQFTSEALSSGLYNLYVINPDNSIAALSPGLPYSGFPTFVTESGSIGTYYETTQISETIEATEANDTITYAVVSGQLPPGSNLLSNGTIIGSAPIESTSNTYSFTIAATDEENQSTTRSFNLTINTDVVTWISPAEGAAVELDGDVPMSNVELSATSAAGYDIIYTANALPGNVFLSGNVVYGTPNTDQTISTVFTATANTTNRTSTRTVNWSVVFDDVYFNQTTLLLNGDENTFITDASDNNFTITPVADTRPSAFSPYNTAWSNYFDGTGDYITTPGDSNLELDGDFTIEFFMYLNSLSLAGVMASNDGSFLGDAFAIIVSQNAHPDKIGFWDRQWPVTDAIVECSTTLATGQWYHVAFVRNSSTLKIYLDGVEEDTETFSDPVTLNGGSTAGLNIGKYWSGDFNGYLSNLRIVKGTAVYTSAFTPPTEPLTAISGTSLLTCQSNRLIDNSTNAFTITRNGDVKVTSFAPFTNTDTTTGSGYFDGTGDYLTVNSFNGSLGSGDYTIEFWFNTSDTNNYEFFAPTVAFAGPAIIGVSGTTLAFQYRYGDGAGFSWTGASIVHDNCWHHLALTRSGTSVKMYVDGILRGQYTNSPVYDYSGFTTNWTLGFGNQGAGRIYQGYLSNFRVVAGTAVYTGGTNTGDVVFTPPTSPLTAISNTSLLTLQNRIGHNNSQPIDESGIKNIVTRNGNASAGTFSPHVPTGWSAYFDGTGDYLNLSSNAALTPANGDFCVECWIYPTAAFDTYNGIFVGNATNGFFFGKITGGIGLRISGVSDVISATAPNINQWTHIAITRSGTDVRLFYNGVQQGSTVTNSTNFAQSATFIGDNGASSAVWEGYISNLRFVKGTAVYTTNFTPPTTPLEPIANTSLLTLRGPSFTDDGPNRFAITRNGDTRITPFSPFAPHTVAPDTYSVYFDGNGDYLTTPSNAAFGFGTGDFTVEGWWYFTGTISTYQRPWGFGDDNDNIELNGSVLRVGGGSQGTLITGSTTILPNTWYHIALVRSSGTYKLYLNGNQEGSSASNSYNSGARVFALMSYTAGQNPSTGYVSNARIVKGTAVYTSNFTPPTAPLTAIANTSLLTCQSPTVIDNSDNAFAITVNGNSQPTKFNPFGETVTTGVEYSPVTHGGSVYFDGTGDFLSSPTSDAWKFGTGNFTIEFWYYYMDDNSGCLVGLDTASNGNWAIVLYSGGMYIQSGHATTSIITNIPFANRINSWTHVVWTRNGSSNKLFLDGVLVGSATNAQDYNGTGTLVVGGASTVTTYGASKGYISNLRITKGQSLYDNAFVPPAAPPTPIAGSTLLINGTNAAIQDKTGRNVLETVGNARVVNGVKKYGTGAMYFDGSGDGLVIPSTQDLAFGTADFTIEAWFNTSTTASTANIYDARTTANQVVPVIYRNGTGLAYFVNGSNLITGGTISTGTWYHIAVSRASGSTKMFLDGVQIGSTYADANNYLQTTVNIGRYGPTNVGVWTGFIDDLRITKGVARYTGNFTPPTRTFRLK